MSHKLIGYDRTTERATEEYDVSATLLSVAKELAHVPADDPDAAKCYALSDGNARDLAGHMHITVDIGAREYFLEGVAD